MTCIILIFGLLINTSALAGQWVSESGRCQPGATVYWKKAVCEGREKESCWNYEKVDQCTHRPQLVREGPWESAQVVEPCLDRDCSDELAAKVCPDGTYTPFSGDLNEDGSLETWCARRSLTRKVSVDPALVAAKDAEIADQAARKTALDQINTRLVQCARADLGSITPAQVAQCMQAIARELVRSQLATGEL